MAKEYIEQREGVYYVAGTRVSLDSLVYAFRRGESPETIRQNFEVLQLEEVYGAVAYYLANQVEIDGYLARQLEESEENRLFAEPLPFELCQKLARTRVDPVARAVSNAPVDDEPLSPEDVQSLQEAKEWLARNPAIPHEQVLAELGVTAESIRDFEDSE